MCGRPIVIIFDTINNIPSHKQFQDFSKRLVVDGHVVYHITDNKRSDFDGVKVESYSGLTFFQTIKRFHVLLKSIQPDVVISTFRANHYIDLLSNFHSFKWVMSVQSDFYHSNWYNRFRYRKANKVMVLSSPMIPKLSAMYPHLKERITVVPNSFEFEPLKISTKHNVILHVGGGGINRNGKMVKGTDVLINAFNAVSHKIPEVKLWIVGNYTAEYVSTSKIKFLGRKTHKEVLELMSMAKVLALPSRNEAFGQVFIEAMQNGCALIGTENTGAVDIIELGAYGYLVPQEDVVALSDALSAAVAHYDSAINCWNTYEAKREKFNRDAWIEQMKQLISEIN